MIILDNVTKEYKQGHPALDSCVTARSQRGIRLRGREERFRKNDADASSAERDRTYQRQDHCQWI